MSPAAPDATTPRRGGLRARLERVPELAERWLRIELGGLADPDALAEGRAFRFERVRGRGQLIPVPDPEAFALEAGER